MLRILVFVFVSIISLQVPTVNAALPLDKAAEHGNVAALQEQLSAGADINKKYDIGRSALLIAARNGKLSAVEALAQAGADLNLQDNNGDTALHLAAVYAHRQVVTFLLMHGADTRIRNRSNLTAAENVKRVLDLYGADSDMIAMADYLTKTIRTLPQNRANTVERGALTPTNGAALGEPALFVEYVSVNVEKYKAAPVALQQAAKVALLKRGWTVLKSEPQRFIGRYFRKDIEYRVEILFLPNHIVRIAFLNGYHDTQPNYLRNLEKEMLLELDLQSVRQ